MCKTLYSNNFFKVLYHQVVVYKYKATININHRAKIKTIDSKKLNLRVLILSNYFLTNYII